MMQNLIILNKYDNSITNYFLIITLFIGIFLSLLFATQLGITIGWLFFLILFVATIYFLTNNPYYIIILLTIISPIDILSLDVFGIRLRFVHFFIVIGAFSICIYLINNKKTFQIPLFWPSISFIFLEVILVLYHGFYINSIHLIFLHVFFFLGLWITYLLLVNNRWLQTRIVKLFLIVAIIINLYGLYQLLASKIGLNPFIFTLYSSKFNPELFYYGYKHTIYSTFTGPNTFGAFSAGTFCFCLMQYLNRSYVKSNLFYFTGLIIAFLTVLLSVTRAAYIGCLVGIILAFTIPKRFTFNRILKIVILVFGLLGTIFLSINNSKALKEVVYQRLINVINKEESTGKTRIYTIEKSLEAFYQKPFFGNGPASLTKIIPQTTEYYFGPLGPNFFITFLCDTGIIGLAIILWLLYCIIKRLKYAIIYCNNNEDKIIIYSYIVSGTAIFMTLMFSNQYLVNYIPVNLGILLAICDNYNN